MVPRDRGSMLKPERIIAVGLLSQSDLDRLGGDCARLWPVDETPCFNSLLQAIDDADREVRRDGAAAASDPLPLLTLQIPQPA